jgi:hypothetical protein
MEQPVLPTEVEAILVLEEQLARTLELKWYNGTFAEQMVTLPVVHSCRSASVRSV